MNSIIKKLGLLLILSLVCVSCIISNPKLEECEVKEIVVTKIYEGGVKDIVIDNTENHLFYINRGLEQGLKIEDLQKHIINKKATLHLANSLVGTSRHIAQLKVGDSIFYTEFN